MSGYKGQGVEQDVVAYVLNATAMPNYGSASGTELWVSLHTASPTPAGDQTSSEANYQGYARQPVPRSTSGWTVSGVAATNAIAITFPASTGTPNNTITYVAIGQSQTGGGSDELLFAGPLLGPIPVSNGTVVQFSPGQLQLNVTQTTGVTSISNADGTLTISPTNGVVVASLAALPSAHILVGNSANLATSTAISGDGTISDTGVLTVTKTNGVAFSSSATTDTTNASNITAGTLPAAQLPTVGTITPGAYTNTDLSVDAYGRIVTISNGSGGGGGSGTVVGTSNQIVVTTSGSTSTVALANLVDLDSSNISGVKTSSFTTNIGDNAATTFSGSFNVCPGYFNGVPSYSGSYYPALASLQGTSTLSAGSGSIATGIGSVSLLAAAINTGGTGSSAVTYTIQPKATPAGGSVSVTYKCYLPQGNSTTVLYNPAATPHQYLQYIDGNGMQNLAQPSFSDLVGFATLSQGGTGTTSLTANGVTVVNAGATAFNTVAPGVSGNVLTSNGTTWVSAAPGSGGGVTPVSAGGTNTATLPANGVLVSNSSGNTVATVAPGAVSNVLMSNGTSWASQSLSNISPLQLLSVTYTAAEIAALTNSGVYPAEQTLMIYNGFMNIYGMDVQVITNGTAGAAFTSGANLILEFYKPNDGSVTLYTMNAAMFNQVAVAGNTIASVGLFGPHFVGSPGTFYGPPFSNQTTSSYLLLSSTSTTKFVVGTATEVIFNIYYTLSPAG